MGRVFSHQYATMCSVCIFKLGGKKRVICFHFQCHNKEIRSFLIFTLSAEEQGLDHQLAANAGVQYIAHIHTHHPPLLAVSFICPINASYTQTTSSAAASAHGAMKSICTKREAIPLAKTGMPLCCVNQDLNARKTRA